jgi:HAD superfamily hydrolase (TIGR01549 family)
MRKPSFIYFDLDNTLLDHTSAEAQAQQVTYQHYPELQQVDLDEWLASYKMINHRLWERYQKDEVDRTELQIARFRDSMIQLDLDAGRSIEIGEFYMNAYRNYWRWVDGAKQALIEISSSFRSGIITNGFKETQQLKFDKLGLQDYCNPLLITEEIGKMKPHPVVFDVATDKAGVDRSDILYVGDSYTSDIVGGKNAGWSTAWFTAMADDKSAQNENKEIKPDFEFQSFDELLNYLGLS